MEKWFAAAAAAAAAAISRLRANDRIVRDYRLRVGMKDLVVQCDE